MRGIERKEDGEKRRNEISDYAFDIKMGAKSKTIMNDLMLWIEFETDEDREREATPESESKKTIYI